MAVVANFPSEITFPMMDPRMNPLTQFRQVVASAAADRIVDFGHRQDLLDGSNALQEAAKEALCRLQQQQHGDLQTCVARFVSKKSSGEKLLPVESCSTNSPHLQQNENEGYMQVLGKLVQVNIDTYAPLLRLCCDRKALSDGKRLHGHIVKFGHDKDVFLANLLLEMYGKCGSLEDARRVFDEMPKRNVFTWTIVISAYAKTGHFKEALHLFRLMGLEGTEPNAFTLASIVGASSGLGDLAEGKAIHVRIVRMGCESDIFLATALINMYSKCGSSSEARHVFESMHQRSVVSWNAMISAYVQCEQQEKAFKLFRKMDLEGMQPDQFTLTTIIPSCSSLSDCKLYHERISASGFGSMVTVQNALVDAYGKCGSLDDARCMFDRMQKRDVISWTAMISSYVHNGLGEEALELYQKMEAEGVEPNLCTFTTVIDACSMVGALEEGRVVHLRIVFRRIVSIELGAAIVNMYIKCGNLVDAKMVLKEMCVRNIIPWNVLIGAYAQQGRASEAFQLYQEMALEGTKADNLTFVGILGACSDPGYLAKGESLHAFIAARGLESEAPVGISLINMYANCGSLEDAWRAFQKIFQKNVVTWNALITAYAQRGYGWKALQLYEEMMLEGCQPDMFTFATVLGACSSIGALEEGKAVHAQMLLTIGLETDVVLGTSLVNMYAKCGSLDNARYVFDSMFEKNIVSWTALIAGYAQHGQGGEALWLFEHMNLEGYEPDCVTFTSILHGCNHGGLHAEGRTYFVSMRGDYDIMPTFEHYDCMIDLLGRAGRLKEAERLILDMPFHPRDSPWVTLLGACKMHVDVERGERAAGRIFELDSTNAASYVMLSNIWKAEASLS